MLESASFQEQIIQGKLRNFAGNVFAKDLSYVRTRRLSHYLAWSSNHRPFDATFDLKTSTCNLHSFGVWCNDVAVSLTLSDWEVLIVFFYHDSKTVSWIRPKQTQLPKWVRNSIRVTNCTWLRRSGRLCMVARKWWNQMRTKQSFDDCLSMHAVSRCRWEGVVVVGFVIVHVVSQFKFIS